MKLTPEEIQLIEVVRFLNEHPADFLHWYAYGLKHSAQKFLSEGQTQKSIDIGTAREVRSKAAYKILCSEFTMPEPGNS